MSDPFRACELAVKDLPSDWTIELTLRGIKVIACAHHLSVERTVSWEEVRFSVVSPFPFLCDYLRAALKQIAENEKVKKAAP